MGLQDSVYGPDHDEVGKIAARAPKRKAAEPENAAALAASRDWKVCHAHVAISLANCYTAHAISLLHFKAMHDFEDLVQHH